VIRQEIHEDPRRNEKENIQQKGWQGRLRQLFPDLFLPHRCIEKHLEQISEKFVEGQPQKREQQQ
jgi:hypothetical protein